ncbi:MAG: IS110 family transposase [Acidimicrobiales bacterium]|nr:IS110 family transposase [Acidimicrobiales bacterium]
MRAHVEEIVVGVDTHAEFHCAVAVDHLGRELGVLEIPTTTAGYEDLVRWASGFGDVQRLGVEGTGAYGAGLARFLTGRGLVVIEVNRPNRQHRRQHGKSDPVDALAAARAVVAGVATVVAKDMCGLVESVRVLHVTRRSAVKAKTTVANQMKDLVLTAPEPVRQLLRGLTTTQRVRVAAKWRPGPVTDPTSAARVGLHTLAKRWIALRTEIKATEKQMQPLLEQLAPSLLAEHGVGLDVAARLVIAAGENPQRLRSEASFAALCGTSPVPASSGKTQRHRLNRGGNRSANNALHTVVLHRARTCPETRAYIDRRRAEGKTNREIWRCLKRTLARRFHHHLIKDLATLT